MTDSRAAPTWPWCDLSAVWDEVRAAARVRDHQKRGYRSSRYWNHASHFIGLLGETVYGRYVGLAVNLTLRRDGFPGADFPGVEIKAVGGRYWRDPYLKHRPVGPWTAARFVLVAIDETCREGALVGWATREDVRAALMKDWGHGPQHSLHHSALRPFPLPFAAYQCACGRKRAWAWDAGWQCRECPAPSGHHAAISAAKETS